MKLIYWYVEHKTNEDLSIREKTKKTAVTESQKGDPSAYCKPIKVSVSYKSGFDLMKMCLSKERKFWGVVK